MASEYDFDSSFQDLILACMARHPTRFVVYGTIVLPEYFWGLQAAKVCRIMQNYAIKTGFYPSFEALPQLVLNAFKRDERDRAEEAVAYVKKIQKLSTRDVNFVVEQTINFARESALINAVRDAMIRLKEKEWPEGGFSSLFDKAMRVGEDVSDAGYSAVDDSDDVIDLITQKSYGIKTHWPELDKLWFNGWGPGWLVVPLAPPKTYKTAFCINLAVNMAMHGGAPGAIPIFYYACEISAELALVRAYSKLTGWTTEQIFKQPGIFKTELKNTLLNKLGAPIIVKFFPAKTTTIADIRAHAKSAMEIFRNPDTGEPLQPRAIFIDHAETIKPAKSAKGTSDWRQQSDIYTEARAMGAELNCTIVMPDRCNKEASERAVPSMTAFQGAFEKAGIVDVAIGLCQTPEERATNICAERDNENNQLYQKNRVRYFVFVNRHGRQYVHLEGTVRPETMDMTVDSVIPWEPEENGKARTGGGKAGAKPKANGDNAQPRQLADVPDR